MTNKVSLCGRVISKPKMVDTLNLTQNLYFMLDISTNDNRASITRVMVSDKIYNDAIKVKKGDVVFITGHFASFIISGDNKAQKFLYVYAKEIKILEHYSYFKNNVILTGSICGDIVQRKHKVDFTMLVKIPNCNTSYIPCVLPLEVIEESKELEITRYTAHYRLCGYINSRRYKDKCGKGRVAYEVVAKDIEKLR